MSTTLLIGPPGTGKTLMASTSEPPIHYLDIDRKIRYTNLLKPMIDSGDLTFWELRDTIAEEGLAERAKLMSMNKKPTKAPLGWLHFAQMVEALKSDEHAQRASTWVVDSLTLLGPHLRANILFHASGDNAGATFSAREWGYWLTMWQETVTVLRDTASEFDKHLIMTVHERVSEIPNQSTKIVHSKVGNQTVRDFLGTMEMKIAASIEGQFGILLPSMFTEVYALSVEIDSFGKPKWVCRVKPDGLRDLRTSYGVEKEVFEPNFKTIWNSIKPGRTQK